MDKFNRRTLAIASALFVVAFIPADVFRWFAYFIQLVGIALPVAGMKCIAFGVLYAGLRRSLEQAYSRNWDNVFESILKKHCPEAHTEQMFWGGRRVIAPFGELVFKDGHFKKPIGGKPIVRLMVILSVERWGNFRVNGPPALVEAAIAWGEELYGDGCVTPIVKDDGEGCLKTLIWSGCIVVALTGAWPFLDGLQWWAGGVMAASLAMLLISIPLKKALERHERFRGNQFYNPFPQAHGDIQAFLKDKEIEEKYFEP